MTLSIEQVSLLLRPSVDFALIECWCLRLAATCHFGGDIMQNSAHTTPKARIFPAFRINLALLISQGLVVAYVKGRYVQRLFTIIIIWDGPVGRWFGEVVKVASGVF